MKKIMTVILSCALAGSLLLGETAAAQVTEKQEIEGTTEFEQTTQEQTTQEQTMEEQATQEQTTEFTQTTDDSALYSETEIKNMETADFEDFAAATAELIRESDTQNGTQGVDAVAQDRGEYATKRLLVKSRGESLDFSALGAKTVIAGPDYIYILQFPTQELTRTAMEQISSWASVEYCEVDAYSRVEDTVEVKNAAADRVAEDYLSWGAKRIGVDQYVPYMQQELGDNTAIVVAVVDSGVEESHPLFSGKIAPGGYDYVNGDSDTNDDYWHGTHVAGIIADCTRGLDVKILPIKVLDNEGWGSNFNIANGIRRAVNKGAKVINYSISGPHDSDYKEEAIRYARKAGVTVVAAAGNENEDMIKEEYCPGHMKQCIVVGAVDEAEDRYDLSNYGETLDIAAPGVKVLSAYPGGEYAYGTGTSMACPHVAAEAAMFQLMYPSYSPSQIEILIKQYKRDLGQTGRDIYYGYGIPCLAKAILKSPFTTEYSSSYSRVYEPLKTQKLDIKARTALTYRSSNTAVAKVNSSGTVTLTGCGKAVITVSAAAGVGYYADSKEISFKVLPKKQKISSLRSTRGTGSFTVSYQKNTAGTGYQVRYATKSNFSDGVTVKVYKNYILSHKVSGLVKGQSYYVKVRTYKAKNGSYYYGKYSNPIKITIL